MGYDNPPSLQRDHVQTKSVIKKVIGQSEAEQLGIVAPMSETDRGSADRAWASLGTEAWLYSDVRKIFMHKINDTRAIELTFRYNFNAAKSKYKGTGAANEERNRIQ